ncbi:MAG TPA: exodeoxyribonuclease VII large subunit [Candidatus Saccharimonadales bacterium]|nr:exodeoxyribonuclease VII large subunit [Candidatus Saccharimonadales bacterium]
MDGGERLIFGVSDFVAYLNQTLEIAYPYITIEGEISNFRVSKNRWVYFDLKDAMASVRFFGTVYALPGPLQDGMVVRVSGSPRLHPQYGFSVNFVGVQPVGEGSIRKAADLLAAKLQAEGLFAPERKRPLAYPPGRIALITAGSSAAYADFMKILGARWAGVTIDHYDVLVQGEQSPAQIVSAIAAANAAPDIPDVIVLTRGGGSAEDLGGFSTEQVTRAVAGSRVPTLVAIGHEVDISLAELAADQRASTPSNAAELLTPDRTVELAAIRQTRNDLGELLVRLVVRKHERVTLLRSELDRGLRGAFAAAQLQLQTARRLLQAYDPTLPLQRGYAIVRRAGVVLRSLDQLDTGDDISLTLQGGMARATITGKEPERGTEK